MRILSVVHVNKTEKKATLLVLDGEAPQDDWTQIVVDGEAYDAHVSDRTDRLTQPGQVVIEVEGIHDFPDEEVSFA
jgi:hypothetical protein